MALIEKYFVAGHSSSFNLPASAEQISAAEDELGIVLPQGYKDFLLLMNGFEGAMGESYVAFEPVEHISEHTRLATTQFFPWSVYIGCNGGLEMYVIDKQTDPFRFGLLPCIGDENDFIPLGDTFEGFLLRLYDGTAFEQM